MGKGFHRRHLFQKLLIISMMTLSASADDAQIGLKALKAAIEAVQVEISNNDAEHIIEKLREADTTLYSQELSRSLAKLSAKEAVAGVRPLKYTNTVVVDFVLAAYIDVVEAERAYEEAMETERNEHPPKVLQNESSEGEGGESGLEFLDALSSLAESTLSEKLYDYIWEFPQPSPYRRLFVASVLPDKTLKRFALAKRGRVKEGQVIAPDHLFNTGSTSGIQLYTALVHVADICDLNPEIARQNRDTIVSLISQYGLHYANPSSEYIAWRDYIAREASMSILAEVGELRDLPLLEKLAKDAPVVSPSRRIEKPQDLLVFAETIREKLESGSGDE